METVKVALQLFKDKLDSLRVERDVFGNFPTLFLSLVGEDGAWEHYGGNLKFVDARGKTVVEDVEPKKYKDYIGEAVEPYSYLKFPYFKPLGYPDGCYRVGPLARLNTCKFIGTPIANAELTEYRERYGTANSSFLFHYARLIEMIAATETVQQLLEDPAITGKHLRSVADINHIHGVGVSEAPRGTLFHDYTVDEDGLITKDNLLIATGQNNLAMNKTVAQIAKHYITGPEIPEGVLNRIEHGIRTFDPCLSCSTHAYGDMPLHVQLLAADGRVVDEVKR
jgi:NAD-reducing hydrogenase large subunit